jgi:hypothetical protein
MGEELAVLDAEFPLQDVAGRQSGEAAQFAGQARLFGGGELVASPEGRGVIAGREGAGGRDDLGDAFGLEVGREFLVIPGAGGVAGQELDVGIVVLRREFEGLEIERRGNQDDPVEIKPIAVLEVIRKAGGAGGAIALAQDEFGESQRVLREV